MTARELECKLEFTNPLNVTIEDEGKLELNTRCPIRLGDGQL